VTEDDVKYGLYRILAGLVKVFALAAALEPWSGVFSAYDRPFWQLWVALYVFAVYFYLNFAGYSDLAIGTGRLFGMVLPENFRMPLIAKNPQLFWSRWHGSLSRFAQRYIFMGLGGVRAERRALALFMTIMTIALWHEFSKSYVLYGLYHGTGLVAHDYWTRNRPAAVERVRNTIVWLGPKPRWVLPGRAKSSKAIASSWSM
jgi:D-alanyl-lipoteichoic acid acyltransferase DltB (MBOAT superfamily)